VSAELLSIAVTTSVAAMFEITTANETDREPLLRLLAACVKPAAFKNLADDEILVARARSDAAIAGALVWRLSSDLTAFVWCPVVDAEFQSDAEYVQRLLLNELIRRADLANAWFAQCLLQSKSNHDRTVMLANGFTHIAALRTLKWKPDGIRSTRVTDDALTVHDYEADSDRPRLIRLLEATWGESLDCPKLNGHRTGAEAVQSHDGGDTSLWRFFRLADQDVGMALVSMGESGLSLDYIGVVPHVRGHGIGQQILQHVLNLAETKELAVHLSVDMAIEPAIRIYESLGFEPVRQLEVLGRFHPNRV
jgi:ribosomal protein S18 acetylase RimI-like enzyme